MIYPSYATEVRDLKKIEKISSILDKLCIADCHRLNGKFAVDGYSQKVKIITDDFSYPIVSPEEFIQIYTNFYEELHQYVEGLQIGDKVIIEPRRMNEGWYPFSYAKDMDTYANKELTIISKVLTHFPIRNRNFYNGTDYEFSMEECPGWLWHSSMFKLGKSSSLTVVKLSPIVVDPLVL